MDQLTTKTATIRDADIKKLTDDPKNIVYEYKYDSVERVKTSAEVKALMKDTHQQYNKMKAQHPDWSDDECRRNLMEQQDGGVVADFCRSHPLIFKTITDRSSTPQQFQMIFFQLNLMRQVETGSVSKDVAGQQVQMASYQLCKTGKSYDEWKRDNNK